MIDIICDEEKLKEQILLVIKLFVDKDLLDKTDIFVMHSCKNSDDGLRTKVELKYFNKIYNKESFIKRSEIDLNSKNLYHYIERESKIIVYKILSKIFNKKMPWGALTGIRPTKLFSEKVESIKNINAVNKLFRKTYLVSKKRINICNKIFKEQSKVKFEKKDKYIDFYINIPFCTSRCYYCSFLSTTIEKGYKLIKPYVDSLCYDISKSLEFIKKKNLKIKNIYIGGGTPTAIPLEDLEKILSLLPKVKELTVESGRPDTISKETFEIFKKYNVTRISINPQTFNDKTLKIIGRKHSAQECIEKYNMAREYNFIINMDLIAGLSGENYKDFKYSLNKALELSPDNITIHTLCYKRTSNLSLEGGETSSNKSTEKMVEFSIKKLLKNGYNPYYLYKQKNTIANLENIGYAKNSLICEFNIDSMEEIRSIFACGANGISKRLFIKENKIERFANVKNIEEYISRIDEMIEKKFQLFS